MKLAAAVIQIYLTNGSVPYNATTELNLPIQAADYRFVHAMPSLPRNPPKKTPLDERRYIPPFSVQSLYVVELKLPLCTHLARQTCESRIVSRKVLLPV